MLMEIVNFIDSKVLERELYNDYFKAELKQLSLCVTTGQLLDFVLPTKFQSFELFYFIREDV